MKKLSEISDEDLVRAITQPLYTDLDEDRLDGHTLDRLDDNAFLRALSEPTLLSFEE